MAGGMSQGQGRHTLAERSAALDATEQATPVGRHCWVRDSMGGPGRAAGLLVEWRRCGVSWEDRVVYLAEAVGRPALIEVWLPAFMLDP